MNCEKCGLSLAEKNPLCPYCGAFQPHNVPEFVTLQTLAVELLRRYSSGAIHLNVYQAELEKLILQDSRGIWWTYDPAAGQWLNYQNHQWIPLPVDSAASLGQMLPSAPSGSRKQKSIVTLIAVLLPLLILFYVIGGFLLAGFDDYQALAKVIEEVPEVEVLPSPYVLSSAQAQIRLEYGTPESFSILFYQEEQMDGSMVDTRTETWTYYSSGMEFSFIDGELEGSDAITHDLEGMISTVYVPEQFTAGMSLEDVAAAAGVDSYLYVPLDSELVEDGRLYYAPQLSWGFKRNALAFVQGLALEEGGGQ